VRRILQLLVLLLSAIIVEAQEKKDWNPNGTLSGEFRSYLMGTINKGELRNWRALGLGGHVKYVHRFGKFQVGGALYVNWNTNIQDLTVRDPATNQPGRYETGLFDLADLNNRFFILPGELFMRYATGGHSLTLGRMKLRTPFLNGQDGRMIPTLEQGLWYQYKDSVGRQVKVGIFNAISPRGTAQFYNIGNSIGIFGAGRNPDGSRSGYAGNTQSNFIATFGLQLPVSNALQVDLWNYYVDNVSNSLYLRPTVTIPDSRMSLSAEWLHQDRVGEGGNANDSLRYFSDQSSDVLGIQVRRQGTKGTLSLAYNRIFAHGRYLFPREWGREFLFSFQKRERSEGTADSHSVMFAYDTRISFGESSLRTIYSIGRHWKPSVLDAAKNKYGIPSYTHINIDLFLDLVQIPRLKPELLVAYKINNASDFDDNPRFIINRVDMWNFNFVVNYRF